MKIALSHVLGIALLLSACTGKQAPPSAEKGSTDAKSDPAKVSSPVAVGFEKTLELQGIKFRVTCQNASSGNRLRIIPAGLETDNSPISRDVDGTVTGAEVADLDVDGSPEVYVYVQSAGSGSYGSVVAYSANRRKSLSEIYMPPVTENKQASKGYMGHDEFAVVESTFVQRFPIYAAGDPNTKPSGKTRQLQYKLKPGEAGWMLRLDKTIEY